MTLLRLLQKRGNKVRRGAWMGDGGESEESRVTPQFWAVRFRQGTYLGAGSIPGRRANGRQPMNVSHIDVSFLPLSENQ